MTVSSVAFERTIFPTITCATHIQEPVVYLIFFTTANTPSIFLIPKRNLTDISRYKLFLPDVTGLTHFHVRFPSLCTFCGIENTPEFSCPVFPLKIS